MADLPDLHEINGDPEVTRYLPYDTWRSVADGDAWLARMQALTSTGEARQLVIVRRRDDKVIGTALLFKHDERSQRLEIGYVLGRNHWRQGYASEALSALLDQLFNALGIRRVEAEVHLANGPSNQLLRSLGFTHEGTLRERWVAKGQAYGVHVHGLLANEWPRHEA